MLSKLITCENKNKTYNNVINLKSFDMFSLPLSVVDKIET